MHGNTDPTKLLIAIKKRRSLNKNWGRSRRGWGTKRNWKERLGETKVSRQPPKRKRTFVWLAHRVLWTSCKFEGTRRAEFQDLSATVATVQRGSKCDDTDQSRARLATGSDVIQTFEWQSLAIESINFFKNCCSEIPVIKYDCSASFLPSTKNVL